MPLVEVDGGIVSSTRIRALVSAGEVDEAMDCLGAPYMMEGEVVTGDQRGRELGFPTANLVPDDALIVPGHGVYAAFANGHPAAVNVGVRPDLRDRARPAGRVLPDRLRRGPLRAEPAGRVRRAPEGREALPGRRGAGRGDEQGRGRRPRGVRTLRGQGRRGGPLTFAAAMPLTKDKKQELIGKYGRSDTDTGSAEVQVAMLTERINELTEHLRTQREGPPLAPRPAEDGRPPPSPAALPREQRPGALPLAGLRARPSPLAGLGA